MNTNCLVGVSIVCSGLCLYYVMAFPSSSSLVLESYKEIVGQSGRSSVGDRCNPKHQWEVARLMAGLTKKTVWDLTEEEKLKVNMELVEKGREMCSLKKEFYCLDVASLGESSWWKIWQRDNSASSSSDGTCHACEDLESIRGMGNDLKRINREFCENARKIAKSVSYEPSLLTRWCLVGVRLLIIVIILSSRIIMQQPFISDDINWLCCTIISFFFWWVLSNSNIIDCLLTSAVSTVYNNRH